MDKRKKERKVERILTKTGKRQECVKKRTMKL